MNRWLPILRWLVLAGLICFAGQTEAAAADIAGRATVIDGDSLTIGNQEIRLWGIDAFEANQSCRRDSADWSCGGAATTALEDIVRDRPIHCREVDVDRYDRSVARCRVGEIDIGEELVRRGMALAYRRHSDDYYERAESEARNAGRGLWAGTFVPPWDWRRGKRLAEANQPPETECPIKGNINRKGKRIYHMPDTRDYDRTRINTSKGERWFCSEEEARAAGWRRAGE